MGAVARCLADAGVYYMLLRVFADNGPARRFYESFGGVPVAEDGFEIGGAWLVEVAYGWRDTGVLYENVARGQKPALKRPVKRLIPARTRLSGL